MKSLIHFRCYFCRNSRLTYIGMSLRFAVSGPRTVAGRDVHRSAVRGEPLPHRREEVRPEAVRPGDLVQPADGVALQRRLRTIFGLKVSDLPRPALHRPTLTGDCTCCREQRQGFFFPASISKVAWLYCLNNAASHRVPVAWKREPAKRYKRSDTYARWRFSSG